MESDDTDTSSSVPHQLVHVHTLQNRSCTDDIYTKQRGLHNSSTSSHVYCAHAAGVSREVTQCIRQTAHSINMPTLSMAFTSNPQELTRYSTMDSWPNLAARCKAVAPTLSLSKRWPSIFGTRYSATARWPRMAHMRKVLCPPCIEQ